MHLLIQCVLLIAASLPSVSSAASNTTQIDYTTPFKRNAIEDYCSTSCVTPATTVSTSICNPKATVTVTTNSTTTVTAQATSTASIQDTSSIISCVPTVTKLVTHTALITTESLAPAGSTTSLTSTIYRTDATVTVHSRPTTSSAMSNFPTGFWSNLAGSSMSPSVSSSMDYTTVSRLGGPPPDAKTTTTVAMFSTTHTVTVYRTNNTSSTPSMSSLASTINMTTTSANMTATSSMFTNSSTPKPSTAPSTTLPLSTTTQVPIQSTSFSTTTKPAVSECYDSNINQPTHCSASPTSSDNGPNYSGAVTTVLNGSFGRRTYTSIHFGWFEILALALATQAAFFLF